MAVKSVNKKVRKSIVTATAATIFSLATAMVGTYAWFASSTSVTTTGMQVTVVSSGACDMEDVKVIKFDYGRERIGDKWSIDYLKPENGQVSEYGYSKRTNENSFGYYAGKETYYVYNSATNPRWTPVNEKPNSGASRGFVDEYDDLSDIASPVNGNYCLVVNAPYKMYFKWDSSESDWVVTSEAPAEGSLLNTYDTFDLLPSTPSTTDYYAVNYAYWNKIEAMNVYDPVDKVVRHSSLKDLNCNAIYEATFMTNDYHYLDLDLIASTRDDVHPDASENEKLLSDFIDIDIFFESDLLDSNPLFVAADDPSTHWVNEADDLAYYPSYKFVTVKKYYEWTGSAWALTDGTGASRGTGIDRGTVNYQRYLPTVSGSPVDGDYYYVTANEVYFQWDSSETKWNEVEDSGDLESGVNKGTVADTTLLPIATGDYYEVLKGAASVLTDLEKIYYKISYLASLIPENGHKHFYGATTEDKQSVIHIVDNEDKTITFAQGVAQKFYINVNYAPSKADPYYSQISLKSIKALYDYKFEFNFSNGVSF